MKKMDARGPVRPWGRYDILKTGADFKVKLITVKPKKRLSLQRHRHRSEQWTIVEGTAVVTVNGHQARKRTGDVVRISQGTTHRIANAGTKPLRFIEIQHGAYLGEDDIQRLEDDFGRV